MSDLARYRREEGAPVLDVKVVAADRLFDNRDPAPFRDRDLDPGLVDYLIDGAHELAPAGPLHIVFWLARPCAPGEVEQAVQAHFQYEIDRGTRVRRRAVGTGWIALAIAAVVVVILVALSELVARAIPGTLGTGLKEALVISGWVLMWRPMELLVYDGIPWRRERKILRALRDAKVDVRAGEPPPAAPQ
jgi:hypothetical protein